MPKIRLGAMQTHASHGLWHWVPDASSVIRLPWRFGVICAYRQDCLTPKTAWYWKTRQDRLVPMTQAQHPGLTIVFKTDSYTPRFNTKDCLVPRQEHDTQDRLTPKTTWQSIGLDTQDRLDSKVCLVDHRSQSSLHSFANLLANQTCIRVQNPADPLANSKPAWELI